MAIKDKCDYYQVKAEYVKPLLDEYLATIEVMNEEIEKTARKFGATGCVQTTSIGRSRITGFAFPKNCKFDFKFSSEEIGDELVIKPYKNSKLGKEFAQKMDAEIKRLDDKYKGKIVIGDWLINKFDCYREGFHDFNFITSWAGADTKKQLIAFKIPKTDKPFNPPKELEQITYGKLYDLINS